MYIHRRGRLTAGEDLKCWDIESGFDVSRMDVKRTEKGHSQSELRDGVLEAARAFAELVPR